MKNPPRKRGNASVGCRHVPVLKPGERQSQHLNESQGDNRSGVKVPNLPTRDQNRKRWRVGEPPPWDPTGAGTVDEDRTDAARRRLGALREGRNEARVLALDSSDRTILGESKTPSSIVGFLSSDASSFFRGPVIGPNDSFVPPAWFLSEIERIAEHVPPVPKAPPFRFEPTEDAARENAAILAAAGYSLGTVIERHADSTIGYGSEFRSVKQLKPLLQRHPNFVALSELINEGMSYVFTRELDDDAQRNEMLALMDLGNHKSAQEGADDVRKLLAKDVVHGFSIPLPLATLILIPRAGVQPLGLVSQWTVDAEGKRTRKHRVTQDLSFSSVKGCPPTSINGRINMDAYPEMVYGWCLPRILHFVVALRTKHPTYIILVAKYDYSDAYRRVAHSAQAAVQTIAILPPLAYMSLRLTFGGAPNPPTWCMFSELVTDLANEIILCRNWNSEQLHSPAQPQVPTPIRLSPGIPMAQAKPMSVFIPIPDGIESRVDGYIDDLINVFLDTPENCRRQPQVVPLAMHITSRPHAGEALEPLPRRTLLSLPKLASEGSPAEVQIVLGWCLDTRRLCLSLPDDKHEAWVEEIQVMIDAKACVFGNLDRLVGRLVHSSHVLPISRHFIGRLRSRLTPRPRNPNSKRLRLTDLEIGDLTLWKRILDQANRGVSLNLLVTRQPDRICWSDACPFGIGGYNLSGMAWRIRIPYASSVRGHPGVNNLLEFIGMAINIWLECLNPGSAQSCILAIGDNTSAIGWLHNTSRLEPTWQVHDVHLMVARHIASLLMQHECCLATQHIKGEVNVVADLLSFVGTDRGKHHPLAYDDPPNDVLTHRFRSQLRSQVPECFNIVQLPKEILSWVSHMLRTTELSLIAVRKEGTRAQTGSGADGWVSADNPDLEATHTSLCFPSSNANFSSKDSCSTTVPPLGIRPGMLQESVSSRWGAALSAKPQATWVRRFGSISGTAPCTSRGALTSALSPVHY